MIIRAVITLLCLATLAWYLDREQEAGRFQRTDEAFLDFLVANTRGELEKTDPAAVNPVVFVTFREQDASEYAAWPPPPIDWQTLLKALVTYQPEVLVIATPLNWGTPSPEFVPAVAESLLKYPSVILAAEAQATAPGTHPPAFLGGLGEALPTFQRIDGDLHLATGLTALVTAPDPTLRNYGELGPLALRQDAQQRWRLPYALNDSETLYPTVFAQALARYAQTPYASHRISLGAGAGAYLNGGRFIPLTPNSEYPLLTDQPVVTINALSLMTGTLADGLAPEDKAKLQQARLIVVGLENNPDSGAAPTSRLLAESLTHALTLPVHHLLELWQQWLALGLALVGGLWLVVRVPRGKALGRGLGLIFAAFVVSFLLFQSQRMWFPPTIPAALLAAATLLGLLIGKGKPKPAVSTSEAPPPASV